MGQASSGARVKAPPPPPPGISSELTDFSSTSLCRECHSFAAITFYKDLEVLYTCEECKNSFRSYVLDFGKKAECRLRLCLACSQKTNRCQGCRVFLSESDRDETLPATGQCTSSGETGLNEDTVVLDLPVPPPPRPPPPPAVEDEEED
ncbi:hypothetical protein PAPYR_2634 [Paratrimastix pyriformis]|uniref:Uncharacterized protein n=1 Tax=Paratrimastix pyriformis TaxID=342808 RepID=A0ABQ8UPT4_9EUKA|nr:hypothetical protein PAPYR_2634 [Paratrimastix pyriformis]